MAITRVLLIDDDPKLLERVKAYLRMEGYAVETAKDGPSAMRAVRRFTPDLVVLDVNLPPATDAEPEPADGIDVLRRLRDDGDVSVLMLSTTSVGAVKVMALSLGADDYMTKPFDMAELGARIKAILRRTRKEEPGAGTLTFKRLRIDPEGRQAWKDGRLLDLTPVEFELLHTLAARPGRVFTREQLIEQAWKHSYFGVSKVVDVHIGHLRRKIEDDPAHSSLIVTVRGAGFRFDDTQP